MRVIDISARKDMTITGNMSNLVFPFGKNGEYVRINLRAKRCRFELYRYGRKIRTKLKKEGITYDFGSVNQWSEVKYINVEVKFRAGGRVAEFTINYESMRDTGSDGGIYESMRPYSMLFFIDTFTAARLTLAEVLALEATREENGV